MKHLFFIFLTILANITLFSTEGFVAGTLIKTPDGYTAIEKLRPGDIVCSFNFKKGIIEQDQVSKIHHWDAPSIISLSRNKECIHTAPQQLFFIPSLHRFVPAKSIEHNSKIHNHILKSCFFDSITALDNTTQVYSISVARNHNFYVTQQDVLVHNFFPLIALGFTFGVGGVEIATVSVSAAVASVLYWAMGQIIKQPHKMPIEPGQDGDEPDDDDDDEKTLKEKRKEAEELAKQMGFKETKDYKFDSHGEKVFQKGMFQISRDKYRHKGAFWKMFEKGIKKRFGSFSKDLLKKIGE